MAISVQLDPVVRDLAIAIGIVRPGNGGAITLNEDFFRAPWSKLSRIFSDDVQRAALVSAMEELIERAEPLLLDAIGASGGGGGPPPTGTPLRSAYPLLDADAPGQIYVIVTRAGAAPGSAMQLAIAGEVQAANDGPGATGELVLLKAENGHVTPVGGTPDHPLTITVSAPASAGGARIAATAKVVAPPDEERSRFAITLDLGDGEPIAFDLAGAGSPIGRLATLLLDLALAQIDPLPPVVGRIAHALPGMVGLAEGMPDFPFSALFTDPNAFRDWLAALATAQLPDGRAALGAWVVAIGTLMGVAAPAAGSAAGPFVLPLLEGTTTAPGLTLSFALAADPADGVRQLLIGLAIDYAGSAAVDAALRADAQLLAIPLGGGGRVRVLERFELRVDATASGTPLVPATGAGMARFGVGGLRAGVRCSLESGTPAISPVLELTDVTVGIGSQSSHFDRIDFTRAGSLTSAAEGVLEDALEAGLGAAGAKAVDALRTLVGLKGTPALDLSVFARDPLGAIGAYYRALLATTAGWGTIVAAAGELLGNAAGQVAGAGTASQPWRVRIEALPTPAESPVSFELACWNGGDDTHPRFVLALRAATSGDGWAAALLIGLLEIAIGGGAPRFLPSIELSAGLAPEPLQPGVGGVALSASSLLLRAGWAPGSTVKVGASVADIALAVGDTELTLGTLTVDDLLAIDPTQPDLGLGLDAAALWPALRLLIARSAQSLLGEGARALLAALGISAGDAILPPLEIPAGGGIGDLLRDPAGALRAWLIGLGGEAEAAVIAAGGPAATALLRLARAIALNDLSDIDGLTIIGGGTTEDPWRLPLDGEESPAAVTLWLTPDGPPAAWAAAALDGLDAFPEQVADASAARLLDLAGQLRGHAPWLADALEGRDLAAAADGLALLSTRIAASDGLLPIEATVPIGGAWNVGRIASVAHADVPSHAQAVAETKAWIEALTSGQAASATAVLLLAPKLAGAGCWDALLAATGVAAADHAVLSLRTPGIPPRLVDLGAVPAAACYSLDLGDDGQMALADSVAALGRAVSAIRQAKPGAKLVIVSHSFLGLVAEAYAADNGANLLGLIALAAPLGPGITIDWGEAGIAEAVRLAQALAPISLATASNATGRALGLLGRLLDGSSESGSTAAPGLLSSARWRRVGPPPDLIVPALAIPSVLPTRLEQALAAALSADGKARTRTAPTTLCWGMEVALGVPPAAAGGAQAEVTLGLKLGEIALTTTAPPPSPRGQIRICARLWRDDGWLIGGPALGAGEVGRIRRADLIASVDPQGTGAATTIGVRLHDTCLRGDGASEAIGLADPRAAGLLDLLVSTLDGASPIPAPIEAVLAALADLGFVRRRTAAAPAIMLADAVRSAGVDGMGWFGARLPALFDRAQGLLGFVKPAGAPAQGGPWALALAGLPLECRIEKAPWRVRIAATGAGLTLASIAEVTGTTGVQAGNLAIDRDGGLALGGTTIRRDAGGGVSLAGGWLRQPVALSPPDPDALAAALAGAIPGFLADSAIRLLTEQAFGGTIRLTSLRTLIEDPQRWLAETFLTTGGLPDATRIDGLIRAVGTLAGLDGDTAHAIRIPGLLGLSVGSGGGQSFDLGIETLAPIALWDEGGTDATLALGLSLSIGAAGQVAPGGSVTLSLPLPATSGFGSVDIHFAAAAEGLNLSVTTTSGLNLTILPAFSGFESVATAGVQLLLPFVLDKLAAELAQASVIDEVLDVAVAMDLYDRAAAAGQGFQAKAANFGALVTTIRTGNLIALAPGLAAAGATVLNSILGQQIAATATGGKVALTMGGVLGGSIGIESDFGSQPIDVKFVATGLMLEPVTIDFDLGIASGDLVADVAVEVAINPYPGVSLAPRMAASLDVPLAGQPARLGLTFDPIGGGQMQIQLAPVPTPPSEAQLLGLLEHWLLPLAGNILLKVADPVLAIEMWTGGKTIGELVVATRLVTRANSTAPYLLATTLPRPLAVVDGALGLLTNLRIPLAGDLALTVLSSGSVHGIGLAGSQRFEIDPYALTLMFGLPEDVDLGWGDQGKGVGLLLLDLTDTNRPAFTPIVRLGGIGATFGRKQADTPLVKAGGFQLGGAGGYLALDVALTGPDAPSLKGEVLGAIEASGIGMLISTGGDGGNAVAASLVKSDGGGDPAPSVPPFDIFVGKGPQGFAISFSGQPRLRIEINRTLGPLHIQEIDLLYNPIPNRPGEVGITLDASVAIAGLEIAADDLGLYVPLDRPADLSQWRIDLSGLAVDYSNSSLSISGGLLKATLPDGSIEYRGSLAVDVSGYGLSAIGAYARPKDASGEYTSLFVFLAISAPIGGPPYLFITGLAGGAGFNRRLLTPRDPAGVPGFPLVRAMDGGGGGDPMEQLQRIGTDIPPSRGGFWIAAGVRFSTFELLHTTALLTVAVDRGFEITLMGLMRLTLPPAEEAAIVSLELALAAKYSTVDQVLSIRAELTNNSWLLSRDCHLTGGFAFVIWFNRPEVLLTVGGYSRYFTPPDHYPVVPRVGFHWEVGQGIAIKGGQFFAITHSAVMVGGSLEASYQLGPIRAWFIADLDMILSWDPFFYKASAIVQVGVEVKLRGCAFGICIELPTLQVTIGATLDMEGPPLSGLVTVDVGVAKFPIPFGTKKPQPFLSWEQIRDKYLGAGSVASVAAGGLAGSGQPDGSEAKPWLVASEFALRIESKMPATALRLNGANLATPGAPGRVDLVPAGPAHGQVTNRLEIIIARRNGGAWQDLSATEMAALEAKTVLGHFPAAVWDGAASHTDAAGNQVVDTSRPMLAALASLELKSAPAIREATGRIGELRFSSMVDEQAARPLSFRGKASAAPAPTPAPVPVIRVVQPAGLPAINALRRLEATSGVIAAAPAAFVQPILSATVLPRGIAASVTAVATAPLPAASRTQIWTLAPEVAHRIEIADAGQRMIALSATGAVLGDSEPATGQVPLPEGVQSLILTEPANTAEIGWDTMTQLVQAGPATYIGPAVVITAPRPWSPRRAPKRSGATQQTFAAAQLSRVLSGLSTRFTIGADRPTALIVRLDRLTPAAAPEDVVIELAGAVAGARTTIDPNGDRVTIVVPLAIDADADAITAKVDTGGGWRLAGLVATKGQSADVARRLRAEPFTRFVPAFRAAAMTTTPVLEIVR
ncbi:DUF6603 domain-containing protein [Sphingomonas sp.]|uniref:DUF6603 domain-containing protein n=1 Tax=Sphingomonas sp. TaxID=28214 RepID=UPI000DB65622|nr:DUF6603 domain-containing protein [Sphingomonas sp.]PZU10107.1 MAG: hypothetical protein DI605_05790 [Sphingomonas sp.]